MDIEKVLKDYPTPWYVTSFLVGQNIKFGNDECIITTHQSPGLADLIADSVNSLYGDENLSPNLIAAAPSMKYALQNVIDHFIWVRESEKRTLSPNELRIKSGAILAINQAEGK